MALLRSAAAMASLRCCADTAGNVHAISGTCAHRGAQLARGWVDEVGGESCVRCPYHAWAIGGDGRLKHVPTEPEGRHPQRALQTSCACLLARRSRAMTCVDQSGSQRVLVVTTGREKGGALERTAGHTLVAAAASVAVLARHVTSCFRYRAVLSDGKLWAFWGRPGLPAGERPPLPGIAPLDPVRSPTAHTCIAL